MARYKWDSPLDWLTEKAQDWDEGELYDTLMDLARQLDSDTLQDSFQSEMDKDGYFRDLDDIAKLSREQCVWLLEAQSIECRDDETVEDLRAAVESNVEDGTIAWADVQEVIQ